MSGANLASDLGVQLQVELSTGFSFGQGLDPPRHGKAMTRHVTVGRDGDLNNFAPPTLQRFWPRGYLDRLRKAIPGLSRAQLLLLELKLQDRRNFRVVPERTSIAARGFIASDSGTSPPVLETIPDEVNPL